MQAKNKPKKVSRPKRKRVCCSLLRKLKPDIENYTLKLVEAQDDSSKRRRGYFQVGPGLFRFQGERFCYWLSNPLFGDKQNQCVK